jgi:hypothetical protein
MSWILPWLLIIQMVLVVVCVCVYVFLSVSYIHEHAVSTENFTSAFPIWMTFISFSCLITPLGSKPIFSPFLPPGCAVRDENRGLESEGWAEGSKPYILAVWAWASSQPLKNMLAMAYPPHVDGGKVKWEEWHPWTLHALCGVLVCLLAALSLVWEFQEGNC